LTAIFNAISIPITIAFSPIWSETKAYETIDMGTNVVFFLDIFVIFNTAFFDKNSEEITDRKRIAAHYIKGMFLIDFISSLPFGQLAPNANEIKLFNMLKIVRVLRISKIINKMKVPEDVKAVSTRSD
jgi:hypothetical protein